MKAHRFAAGFVVLATLSPAFVTLPAAAGAAAAQKVSVALKNATVQTGQATHITGKVSPVAPGKTIKLQRYSAQAWHGYKQKALTKKSTYDFGLKFTATGTYKFRVVAAHGTSKAVTLRVVPPPRTGPPRPPISPA